MNGIGQALLWLDAEPARFWSAAGLAFGAAGMAAFSPARKPDGTTPRWNHLVFAATVIAALAAVRWPAWFYPQHLNPDEAQTVAGAITLDRFPVYWKYVDGTTHGPWCEYFLLFAHWLGAPLHYATARVVAGLLEAGALLAVWGTLRCFTGERVARAAILPGLVFWGLVTWDDFVHYSTELPGLFFLSVAGWLAALFLSAREIRPRHYWQAGLAGVCLGNVPFAKLQSVPQGLAVALLTLGLLWRAKRAIPPAVRWRLAVIFVAGGLAPALLVTVFLGVFGLWSHFHAAYLLSALDYLGTSDRGIAVMPMLFLQFSATEPAFAWFFWGSLAFALVYVRASVVEKPVRLGLAVSWILVGVAYYSVLRPAREAAHYLHLLVAPLTLLAGFSLIAATEEARERPAPGRRALPWVLFLLLTVGPQLYQRAISGHRFANHAADYLVHEPGKAALFLRTHSRPDDTVAMWGWEPSLLVEAGMPHGTRESHTANQLMDWPLRPYYVARYLWDLQRRRPDWFVDAVGPGGFIYESRTAYAHETVPALRDLVAADYEFQGEFQNLRVYRRRPAGRP